MTFGFEREFFLVSLSDGSVKIAAEHGLPHDGCGYLVEARGQAHRSPIEAYYLLRAAEHRLKIPSGMQLQPNSRKLDKKFKHECMRKYGKNPQTDFSVSGRWNSSSLSHAGLHIHFGKRLTYWDDEGKERTAGAGLINIPRIIKALDTQFKTTIKAAKRAPGLYKLKDYGFEYRSLPSDMNVVAVAEFLEANYRDWQ